MFRELCGECHAVSDFRGDDFEWRWRRSTAWNLYWEMALTMPEDDPGSLSNQAYADVIAYILLINDYSSGSSELLPTEKALGAIPLGPGADKTGTGAAPHDR